MKRFICILLSILISITAAIYNISALTAETSSNVKVSLDDNFADDRIIVVLNNQTSLSFKEFSVQDFDEINVKNIKDLSSSAGYRVESAMTNVVDHVTKNAPLVPYEGIPLSNYNQILCLELSNPGKTNVISAIKQLQKCEDVLLAAPDYELVACGLEPTDPNYQSHMNIWAEYIGLEDAWDYASIFFNEENVNAVRVGIIDSGIDRNHPDLYDNLDIQSSENFTQNPLDINYDGGVVDEDGHGTVSASVVGAVANNNQGTAGVCWKVELVSLKVYDGAHFYSSYAADAIDSADEKDIDILSMSLMWNVPAGRLTYGYYNEALDYSISNYSGLFVCAAGNDAEDIDSSANQELPVSYPDLENKIVVGSSNYDNISNFSNVGLETVDLFAQGENIFVPFPADKCMDGTHFDHNNPITLNAHYDTGYHICSGTSLATPLVAGTAAIMICMNSYLAQTPEVIKSKICSSVVDPLDNFEGECISGGRLDAYAAILTVFDFPEDCQHNQKEYTFTATTHTEICTVCSNVLSTSSHSLSGTSLGANSHRVSCSICSYSATQSHQPYTHIVNSLNGTVIKCYGCPFTLSCPHEVIFVSNSSSAHQVGCPEGCFLIFEEHSFIYYQDSPDDLYFHIAECVDCGAEYSLSHNWESVLGGYECTDCGQEETAIPGIMSLSDVELERYLSSLNDDELESFIALLPEDALARVMALLLSEDDSLIE